MSGLFQEIMFQLGVKQFKSSGVSPSISEGFGKIPSDLEVNDQSILFSRKERFGQGDTSLTFAAWEAVQTSLDLVFSCWFLVIALGVL